METTKSRSTNAPVGTGTMRPIRLLYAGALWLGLAVVAILNATVRETLVAPAVGDYWGHVVSTATLVAAIAVVAYAYFGRYADHSVRELLWIGVGWLLLTVAFEFGFGHYVMGNSWSALLADYDLLAGRVWVFVLVTMLVAPLVFGRYLKRDRPAATR